MNRKKSRELAMKALYQIEMNDVSAEQALEYLKMLNDEGDIIPEDEIDFSYIKDIIQGVINHKDEIDEKICAQLQNWTINRISKTNLCILRLSVYEILYVDEIPNVVSVNEAIELAKQFSEDKSSKFINGVLDKFVRNN
ncbi:NusB antitermination factor [Hathewaya proteolytica DSM 3090]|uniref:Transcription antitermination protein NusB n=1 Tax=Hathewaya proteolytica DSM 3090 TaxID=1121331 RepID=A0A1M6L528_9CLOT|nr:transcription antitermination factor NusB [Hathewaya proteolytica]SHJ66224.1 NusB antitermination factor [Hathewaya proteolytica DSM 3090]